MSAPPPAPRRSLARRVAFALVTAHLLLALLEAAARLAEPYVVSTDRSIPLPIPGQAQVAPDSALGKAFEEGRAGPDGVALVADERGSWGLPPSSSRLEDGVWIRTNQAGLRGPQIEAPAPGEERILTLGDSSIFGVQVEERAVFSSVAADALATAWGRPVTAYIGGIPGHDSSQSLQTLQRVGPMVHPTWVVIGNLWSDVFRNNDVRGIRAREELRTPMRSLATWRVLRWWLAPWLASETVRWVDGPVDIGSLDDGGVPPRIPLDAYLDNLRALARTAKEQGARPVFLVLPAPLDFDPTPPPETVQVYRAAIRQVAREEGAPLVDGPPLFVAEGQLSDFIDQVHPSRSGHARLGAALAAALVDAAPAGSAP